VLARLDRTTGVACSFTNGSGTLILVSLQSGADAQKVTGVLRQALRELPEVGVAVRLETGASTTALRTEQWRDQTQVAEPEAPESTVCEMPASGNDAPGLPVALLLVCLAVGLGLLWWRHRGNRPDRETTAGPVPSRVQTGLRPQRKNAPSLDR
jgi:hypothetical protein